MLLSFRSGWQDRIETEGAGSGSRMNYRLLLICNEVQVYGYADFVSNIEIHVRNSSINPDVLLQVQLLSLSICNTIQF